MNGMDVFRRRYIDIMNQSIQDDIGRMTGELVGNNFSSRTGVELKNGCLTVGCTNEMFAYQYFRDTNGESVICVYMLVPDMSVRVYVFTQEQAAGLDFGKPLQQDSEDAAEMEFFTRMIQERNSGFLKTGMRSVLTIEKYAFNSDDGKWEKDPVVDTHSHLYIEQNHTVHVYKADGKVIFIMEKLGYDNVEIEGMKRTLPQSLKRKIRSCRKAIAKDDWGNMVYFM